MVWNIIVVYGDEFQFVKETDDFGFFFRIAHSRTARHYIQSCSGVCASLVQIGFLRLAFIERRKKRTQIPIKWKETNLWSLMAIKKGTREVFFRVLLCWVQRNLVLARFLAEFEVKNLGNIFFETLWRQSKYDLDRSSCFTLLPPFFIRKATTLQMKTRIT